MKGIQMDIRTTVFPLEAIYAACYAFIDRAYVHIDDLPRQTIRVSLEAKEPAKPGELRALEGEFRNELLHHALRLKVLESNRKIREYVVTRALLSAQPMAEQRPGPDGEARTPGPDDRALPRGSAAEATGRRRDAAELSPPPDERKPGPDGYPKGADGPSPRREEDERAREADEALAQEIEKLLADVPGDPIGPRDAGKGNRPGVPGERGETPLGVVAPWEEGAAGKRPKRKKRRRKAARKS